MTIAYCTLCLGEVFIGDLYLKVWLQYKSKIKG